MNSEPESVAGDVVPARRVDVTCPFLHSVAETAGSSHRTHICLSRHSDPITISDRYVATYCLTDQHVSCSLFIHADEEAKLRAFRARKQAEEAAAREHQEPAEAEPAARRAIPLAVAQEQVEGELAAEPAPSPDAAGPESREPETAASTPPASRGLAGAIRRLLGRKRDEAAPQSQPVAASTVEPALAGAEAVAVETGPDQLAPPEPSAARRGESEPFARPGPEAEPATAQRVPAEPEVAPEAAAAQGAEPERVGPAPVEPPTARRELLTEAVAEPVAPEPRPREATGHTPPKPVEAEPVMGQVTEIEPVTGEERVAIAEPMVGAEPVTRSLAEPAEVEPEPVVAEAVPDGSAWTAPMVAAPERAELWEAAWAEPVTPEAIRPEPREPESVAEEPAELEPATYEVPAVAAPDTGKPASLQAEPVEHDESSENTGPAAKERGVTASAVMEREPDSAQMEAAPAQRELTEPEPIVPEEEGAPAVHHTVERVDQEATAPEPAPDENPGPAVALQAEAATTPQETAVSAAEGAEPAAADESAVADREMRPSRALSRVIGVLVVLALVFSGVAFLVHSKSGATAQPAPTARPTRSAPTPPLPTVQARVATPQTSTRPPTPPVQPVLRQLSAWYFAPVPGPADTVVLTLSNRNRFPVRVSVRLQGGTSPVGTRIPAGKEAQLELGPQIGTASLTIRATGPITAVRTIVQGTALRTTYGAPVSGPGGRAQP